MGEALVPSAIIHAMFEIDCILMSNDSQQTQPFSQPNLGNHFQMNKQSSNWFCEGFLWKDRLFTQVKMIKLTKM